MPEQWIDERGGRRSPAPTRLPGPVGPRAAREWRGGRPPWRVVAWTAAALALVVGAVAVLTRDDRGSVVPADTTVPTTVESSVPQSTSPGPVGAPYVAIGDSVMVGAKDLLQADNIVVDARENRGAAAFGVAIDEGVEAGSIGRVRRCSCRWARTAAQPGRSRRGRVARPVVRAVDRADDGERACGLGGRQQRGHPRCAGSRPARAGGRLGRASSPRATCSCAPTASTSRATSRPDSCTPTWSARRWVRQSAPRRPRRSPARRSIPRCPSVSPATSPRSAQGDYDTAAGLLSDGGLEPEVRSDMRPLFRPEFGLEPGNTGRAAVAAALEKWCARALCVQPIDGRRSARRPLDESRVRRGRHHAQFAVQRLPVRGSDGRDGAAPAATAVCGDGRLPVRLGRVPGR